MLLIYYIFHMLISIKIVLIALVVSFSCRSLVVLSWLGNANGTHGNANLKLCRSLEILYWQASQSRARQERQERTFLFMYRDSSENWPHGSLIRKIPITGNPYYAFMEIVTIQPWSKWPLFSYGQNDHYSPLGQIAPMGKPKHKVWWYSPCLNQLI